MDHSIRPLDSLDIHEIVAMAREAANRGEPLHEANRFTGPAAAAFEAAFKVHSGD